MFQKPFRVKTQTSVKSSDRKKIRADILHMYPTLTSEDVAKLVPNKEEMYLTKINTHGDDNVIVYSVGKNPIFYDIFKTLYPTVYTLWEYPDLLPVFRTHPEVFDRLAKGSDLMLPGVIRDREAGPKMFGDLKKGDLVIISLAGNKAPVALGKALLSGEDMYMTGLRGKAVQVMHILGDCLWEMGYKSKPPLIPEELPKGVSQGDSGDENSAEDVSKENPTEVPDIADLKLDGDEGGDDEEGAVAEAAAGAEDSDNGEEESSEEKDPVAEMDELLDFCFRCTIKKRVKKGDLPLLTGNFLRNFMLPYSGGQQLDLKKSSFKKLSKFLQAKAAEGYIVVKEQSKGVDAITEIDKSHLGLKDLQVPDIPEEESSSKSSQAEEETYTPLSFTDVYCVNGVTLDLFKPAGYQKGDPVLLSEVREVVTNYIKANDLQRKDDKKQVTLDPILAHTVLKPAEGDLDHMNWEQVINRVSGKMQAATAISLGSGPPMVKKGKLDPIKLDVVMRASQKKVTIVDNLEDYGIDPKIFARLVQKSVACSCSVAPSEQKNKGPQVTIQGNQIHFLSSLLLEKYKIPKRYVVGLDSAPKQKKKR